MWRNPSTIFMRDAPYAGTYPLRNPTVAATSNDNPTAGNVTLMSVGTPIATEECVNHRINPAAATIPTTPPATARATASNTNSDSTRCRVKPRVFSTATSRVRLRTDIAMVFAETSRMANTTAPQMPRIKAFTFPSVATNES